MMKTIFAAALAVLSLVAPAAAQNSFEFRRPSNNASQGSINDSTGVLDITAGYQENGSNTLTNDISGNAATATALSANGTNCAAGQYARGVDASGNAEDCTVAAGGGDVTQAAGGTFQNTAQIYIPHSQVFTSSHPCRVIESSTTWNIPTASGSNTKWTAGAISGSSVTIVNWGADDYLEVEWEGSFDLNTGGNLAHLTLLLDGVRLVTKDGDAEAPVFRYFADAANNPRHNGRYLHHAKPGAGNHTIALMAGTQGAGTWVWSGKSASGSNWLRVRRVSCGP